jgi:hypothetical protein
LRVDGATAFAGLDQQGLLQKGFEPDLPLHRRHDELEPAGNRELSCALHRALNRPAKP